MQEENELDTRLLGSSNILNLFHQATRPPIHQGRQP